MNLDVTYIHGGTFSVLLSEREKELWRELEARLFQQLIDPENSIQYI